MLTFEKFLSRNSAFTAMKMQGIMSAGINRAMDAGRRNERLTIDGETLAVSWDDTNMSDMIRVKVSRGVRVVGEAFYRRRWS